MSIVGDTVSIRDLNAIQRRHCQRLPSFSQYESVYWYPCEEGCQECQHIRREIAKTGSYKWDIFLKTLVSFTEGEQVEIEFHGDFYGKVMERYMIENYPYGHSNEGVARWVRINVLRLGKDRFTHFIHQQVHAW